MISVVNSELPNSGETEQGTTRYNYQCRISWQWDIVPCLSVLILLITDFGTQGPFRLVCCTVNDRQKRRPGITDGKVSRMPCSGIVLCNNI
jgi:hypothetical protein